MRSRRTPSPSGGRPWLRNGLSRAAVNSGSRPIPPAAPSRFGTAILMWGKGKRKNRFFPFPAGGVLPSRGIRGICRRTVILKQAQADEQIAIVLQSCYWTGRVFVNGVEVGRTKGGYLPSRFDITDQVHDGSNQIAVIVDNRLSTMGVFKRLHAFYWNWGGLLQEVSIERHPSVAVTDMRATGSQSGTLQLWLTSVN